MVVSIEKPEKKQWRTRDRRKKNSLVKQAGEDEQKKLIDNQEECSNIENRTNSVQLTRVSSRDWKAARKKDRELREYLKWKEMGARQQKKQEDKHGEGQEINDGGEYSHKVLGSGGAAINTTSGKKPKEVEAISPRPNSGTSSDALLIVET